MAVVAATTQEGAIGDDTVYDAGASVTTTIPAQLPVGHRNVEVGKFYMVARAAVVEEVVGYLRVFVASLCVFVKCMWVFLGCLWVFVNGFERFLDVCACMSWR